MEAVRVELHEGPRRELRSLFELAEDSRDQLDSYIDEGEVLVALCAGRVVGHLQLTGPERGGEAEIKNMAVLESHQRRGIGAALVAAAIELAREGSLSSLRVATAAADTGNLRFYQRAGFRMRAIERDAFTAATGYRPGLEVDGIPLRDRIWLDLPLGEASPSIQLRVARHTDRLEEVAAFYRDGLGLVQVGGFRDHEGYDGVFLELPGSGTHLELTTGGAHGAPEPHPESLLVLYLGDEEAVSTTAARLGADPVAPANPYWAEHGLTFEDPDGFRVVLVPERWGRNPDHAGPYAPV